MKQERIRNRVDEAVDKARGAAGDLLSGARERVNGRLHQAGDRAEDAYAATLKSLEGTARERPLEALALALGIGFLIGLLSVRR